MLAAAQQHTDQKHWSYPDYFIIKFYAARNPNYHQQLFVILYF